MVRHAVMPLSVDWAIATGYHDGPRNVASKLETAIARAMKAAPNEGEEIAGEPQIIFQPGLAFGLLVVPVAKSLPETEVTVEGADRAPSRMISDGLLWNVIEEDNIGTFPPQRERVLVALLSGYIKPNAYAYEVAYWDGDFRPRRPHIDGGRVCWLDIGSDALSDRYGEGRPTHWARIPKNWPGQPS